MQLVLLTALVLMPVGLYAEAEGAPGGTATLTIEQETPENGILGSWSMIKPDFKRVEMGTKLSHTFQGTPAGSYTVIATPPSGATATVELWINDALKTSSPLPQISMSIADGDSAKVIIRYTFTRVGKVSVTTEPSGLTFVIDGPDGRHLQGTSPADFSDVPEGLYTITFDAIEGCPTLSRKSDKLISGKRVAFNIKVVCEALDRSPHVRELSRSLEYMTVTVDGRQLLYTDVPIDAWFAPFITTAIRSGMMSGYEVDEETGNGTFGPGDSVTLAQLAKVAHTVTGIDALKNHTPPANSKARGTWYAAFVASAEAHFWTVFRDTRVNLERPATRAEVICTLLQALDAPRVWPTGRVFTDVTPLTPYADCIETAARDGLIAGDATSRTFGPERPINRAELAKMLVSASEIYGSRTAEFKAYK